MTKRRNEDGGILPGVPEPAQRYELYGGRLSPVPGAGALRKLREKGQCCGQKTPAFSHRLLGKKEYKIRACPVKKLCFFVDNRAAGEREGARPASQSNNPPPKSLIFQAF